MKLGFIGLGIMGQPMVNNLLKAGFPVKVLDNKMHVMEEFAKKGATIGKSPKEIAESVDILITMLPNGNNVKDIVFSENGLLMKSTDNDLLLLDMSSINPLDAKEIDKELKMKNIKFIDAPVSGGESGAIAGTLTIMAGGDTKDFEYVKPILDVLGSKSTLIGDVGSGNAAKLVNQIIVAGNIAVLSEGYSYAKKLGLDLNVLFDSLSIGLAGSKIMETKTSNIISNEFNPGFKLNLHIKDMNNIIDSARTLNISIPLSYYVYSQMISLSNKGYGNDDHSVLFKQINSLNEE